VYINTVFTFQCTASKYTSGIQTYFQLAHIYTIAFSYSVLMQCTQVTRVIHCNENIEGYINAGVKDI